jgi:hypothetical protein
MTAGCLIAALGVGDTVYNLAPRGGVPYTPPAVASRGNVGDISKLTDHDDDDKQADNDLDSLFAQDGKSMDGMDADEFASIRKLASIAQSKASDWGKDFYKNDNGNNVGGVSNSTMNSVSGAWNSALDASGGPLTLAAIGPTGGSAFVDDYTLASIGAGPGAAASYGGDADGGTSGSGGKAKANFSAAADVRGQSVSVPEPSSLALLGLGGLFLRRRRAKHV